MSTGHHQIDIAWCVETPEGIDLQARIAGPVPRILAYLIDLTVRGIVLILLSVILSLLGVAGYGIQMICAFLLEWFYPVLFEVYRNGQTPGKKQLGLAVINDDLTPVLPGTSFIRNLLRAADFFPLFYVSGLISMLTNKEFRRLGDLAAGTLVVHLPKEQSRDQLPNVLPLAPTMVLDSEDQTAIISFARRHHQLSDDRQRELANILEPILHDQNDAAVNRLHRLGVWLWGGKEK